MLQNKTNETIHQIITLVDIGTAELHLSGSWLPDCQLSVLA